MGRPPSPVDATEPTSIRTRCVGSKEAVDALTARLVDDGYGCVSGPRTTGDGYYESCVLDAEGNRIEVTV